MEIGLFAPIATLNAGAAFLRALGPAIEERGFESIWVPEHVVLPSSLTGVDSPILVVFGDRFPMITAHKVLAAYACLAPRVITGQFDPNAYLYLSRAMDLFDLADHGDGSVRDALGRFEVEPLDRGRDRFPPVVRHRPASR